MHQRWVFCLSNILAIIVEKYVKKLSNMAVRFSVAKNAWRSILKLKGNRLFASIADDYYGCPNNLTSYNCRWSIARFYKPLCNRGSNPSDNSFVETERQEKTPLLWSNIHNRRLCYISSRRNNFTFYF